MKKWLTHTALWALPLLANAQLENPDFETWQNPVDTELTFNNKPNGWNWSQGDVSWEDNLFFHPPVTDAHNGDYALRLSVWYHYAKDMAYQIVPIDYRPSALKGYYTYTDNQINEFVSGDLITDQASAKVYLTKWNTALSQNDTIGTGTVMLDAAAEYTQFTCPITYTTNEIPDTIKVILDCTLMVKSEEGMTHMSFGESVVSIFTIDNLELEEENLGIEEPASQALQLYPNPAKNTLMLPGFSGDVAIYDSVGKMVKEGANGSAIDISSLQAGVYLLAANDGESVKRARFIKE